MDWFTLRVISGKEKKIKETILYDVSAAGMEERVSDILVPSENIVEMKDCLLYTSPSPRDRQKSRMPSSA